MDNPAEEAAQIAVERVADEALSHTDFSRSKKDNYRQDNYR